MSAEEVPGGNIGSRGAPLGGQPTQDERTFGMLAHLLALAGYAIPFGNVVGPLVIWLIKKDEMPFVDDQGKEAVNFQISITIYTVVCVLLFFLVVPILLAFGLGIVNLVLIIVATIKANDGVAYRYPYNLRLIK